MDNKELIKKHLERWEGLQTASIEYYAETGKISGHLYKAIEKMLEEKAKEAYSQGVKDWEAANKRADELMDKLRFKEQYNEAYNQGVRDAAESAMLVQACGEYKPYCHQANCDNCHKIIDKNSILKLLKSKNK